MKKIILALIISITCMSATAKSSDGLHLLQKPTLNTSTLNIANKGLTPVITTRCEHKCNKQFQSCINSGFAWSFCDQQRSVCLFGVDGCYGI